VLSLGPEGQRLSVALLDGQIVGLCPPAGAMEDAEPPFAGPDDSARLKLERVLAEIGLRTRPAASTRRGSARLLGDLRERLLAGLSQGHPDAVFEEVAELPEVVPTAGGTEPLILEAVRRIRDPGAVRSALGALDQPLVATASLSEERTLTLTEGYLLSRIDGVSTARQVLQSVPLDREETERSLLGLLLTGRVEQQPSPARASAHHEAAAPPPADTPSAPAPPPAAEILSTGRGEAPPSSAAMDAETLERRREILEIFQSLPLKNHFEILGVEPGCTDAEVKRAYVTLAKRFHPDVHRDPRVDDLHDVLEAIFIRIGEAWEVLADSRSRASYESRLGHLPLRRSEAPASAPEPGHPVARPITPPSSEPEEEPFFPSDETLFQAQLFITQTHYWEAIQVLEAALPRLQPKRQRQRGRILLARAYAKNPKWLRRAEDTLQDVVREDPNNADAHYELGMLYKASGLAARAHAMFRRAVELRPDHREAASELAVAEGHTAPGILKRFFGKGKGS
jgi:tetratricopeptide (TPR) repeat protein